MCECVARKQARLRSRDGDEALRSKQRAIPQAERMERLFTRVRQRHKRAIIQKEDPT